MNFYVNKFLIYIYLCYYKIGGNMNNEIQFSNYYYFKPNSNLIKNQYLHDIQKKRLEQEGYIVIKELKNINLNMLNFVEQNKCMFVFLEPEWVIDSMGFPIIPDSNLVNNKPNIDEILLFYKDLNNSFNKDIYLNIQSGEINGLAEYIKEELIRRYEKIENKDKIMITVPPYINNEILMPLSYLYEIDEQIKLGIKEIRNSNFSPLEKVMASYFIVQKLINQNVLEKNEKDKLHIVDHIYEGLQKNFITCGGYTSFFNMILKELNINSKLAQGNGHVLNIISIIDEKYGINGNFIFDASMDASLYHLWLKKSEYNEKDIPWMSAISHFGIGKNDSSYINIYTNELMDISDLSIDYFSLIECLYNVYKFIYVDIDFELFKYFFALSIYSRECLINELKLDKSRIEELKEFANEYFITQKL